MYAPFEDKHAPDPKCCGCGLKPRGLGHDILRLILIVLLLLPIILLLSGCDRRRDGFDTPSVALGPCGARDASKPDVEILAGYWPRIRTRIVAAH